MVTVYGGGLHNNGIFLLPQCVHWSFMHNTEAMPDKNSWILSSGSASMKIINIAIYIAEF